MLTNYKNRRFINVLAKSVLFGVFSSLFFSMYVTAVGLQTLDLATVINRINIIKTCLLFFLLTLFFFICIRTRFIYYLHKYRHLFAVALLLSLVLLNINGSSIGFVSSQFYGNIQDNGILCGVSRSIRSDEYFVFTPLSLSQYFNNYDYFSDISRATPTDMFMVYGQAIADVSMIFHPFQIGYLFLGSSRGLSFFWCSRFIALFIFTYDFGLFLTKDNKLLSIVLAVLITFAPAIQWWFSVNGYVEMVVAFEVSILCFDRFMKANKWYMRCLYTAGIMICFGMFCLTLYPPVMIPMAYLVLMFAIWVLINNKKIFSICRNEVFLCSFIVVFFLFLLGRIIWISKDSILSTMNTVYPGSRFWNGGNLSIFWLFDSPLNIMNVFTDKFNMVNLCEDARFIDFAPLGYVLFVLIWVNKRKWTQIDLLLRLMVVVNIIMIFLALFMLPGFIYSVTFLSKSSYRIVFVIQLMNILILIRSIGQIRHEKIKLKVSYLTIAVLSIVVLVAFSISKEFFVNHLFSYKKLFLFIMLSLLCYMPWIFIFVKHKKVQNYAIIVVVTILFVAGFLVNPIRQGIDIVYDLPISKNVQNIDTEDNNSVWLVDGDRFLGNLLIANGKKTINNCNIYPNLDLWKRLDPNNKYNDVYNRYAHILINIVDDKNIEPEFFSYNDDCFDLNCNIDQIKLLGVDYIVSKHNLCNFKHDNNVKVEQISSDGIYSIYRIK